MLTRLLNSRYPAIALGYAAAAAGVLIVLCFVIGAANLAVWLAGVF